MRHFLFEDADNEYKPRLHFKYRRDNRDSAKELMRLVRLVSGKTGYGSGAGVADRRQKCVVKAQYSNSIEAHRKQFMGRASYLEREGTARDGGGAELFGVDVNEYRQNMTAKNFRIFLSPQSDKIDLKKLAGDFIAKVEAQTGFKLCWLGACHYNTAHPHAHLLINGVDKTGAEVKFPRDLIKTFMREGARDLCTAQLGFRAKREMELENEKEITVSRWTRLDERIKSLSGGEAGRVEMSSIGGVERARFQARLEGLRRLGFASYESGGYVLAKNWDEDLKTNGRYNTFLQARQEMGASDMRLYSGAEGMIKGRVEKVYRIDGDAGDNHAVLLRQAGGKTWFIPLFKEPRMRDGKETKPLTAGEFVSVKTYKTQKGRLTPQIFKSGVSEREFEL